MSKEHIKSGILMAQYISLKHSLQTTDFQSQGEVFCFKMHWHFQVKKTNRFEDDELGKDIFHRMVYSLSPSSYLHVLVTNLLYSYLEIVTHNKNYIKYQPGKIWLCMHIYSYQKGWFISVEISIENVSSYQKSWTFQLVEKLISLSYPILLFYIISPCGN